MLAVTIRYFCSKVKEPIFAEWAVRWLDCSDRSAISAKEMARKLLTEEARRWRERTVEGSLKGPRKVRKYEAIGWLAESIAYRECGKVQQARDCLNIALSLKHTARN